MMSDTDNINEQLSIESYDAAGASVAQSIANAAQDQVDLIRNQNIIKTTVMGSAYAKWLADPMAADQYKTILDEVKIEEPKSPFDLATEIFSTYKNESFGDSSNNDNENNEQ